MLNEDLLAFDVPGGVQVLLVLDDLKKSPVCSFWLIVLKIRTLTL